MIEKVVFFLTQHWMLSTAFMGLLVVFLANEWFYPEPKNAKDPNEVIQLINHQDALVIDLRSKEAYTEGHIPSAIHIPMANAIQKIPSLEKVGKRPIVLVCTLGQDASKVCKTLLSQGLNVQVLSGGIEAWRRAGLPLVKHA